MHSAASFDRWSQCQVFSLGRRYAEKQLPDLVSCISSMSESGMDRLDLQTGLTDAAIRYRLSSYGYVISDVGEGDERGSIFDEAVSRSRDPRAVRRR